MTGSTDRARLAALAAFLPVFERPGFRFAEWQPARPEDGLVVLGGSVLSPEGARFHRMVYEAGWIEPFDWAAWRATPDGTRLLHDPGRMACATAGEIGQVLTTCVRADRFCEGYLAEAFEAGLLTRVVRRAAALLGG